MREQFALVFRRCTEEVASRRSALASPRQAYFFNYIRGRYIIYSENSSVAAKLTDQCTVIFFAGLDFAGIGIGCASYISIIFPTENRSDGCRTPREMAKYAWHNLKANVQGEGLPSWPDTDAPPIQRNPTPAIYFDRRDCVRASL